MSISHPAPEDARKQTHEEAPQEQPQETIQSGKKQTHPQRGQAHFTPTPTPPHESRTTRDTHKKSKQLASTTWHTVEFSKIRRAPSWLLSSLTGLHYCTRTSSLSRIRYEAGDRAECAPHAHPGADAPDGRSGGGHPRDQPSFSAERFRCPFLPAGRQREDYGRGQAASNRLPTARHALTSTTASVRFPLRRRAHRPWSRSS